MSFKPFTRMQDRLGAAKSDSDVGFFFDLLLYGEFLTKTIALYLISTINEDPERTKYRFEHALVRAKYPFVQSHLVSPFEST